jgi:hypothetical protein
MQLANARTAGTSLFPKWTNPIELAFGTSPDLPELRLGQWTEPYISARESTERDANAGDADTSLLHWKRHRAGLKGVNQGILKPSQPPESETLVSAETESTEFNDPFLVNATLQPLP